MSEIVFSTPGSPSQQHPVSRAVAGPAKALRINEGLGEPDGVPIHSFPVVRQSGRHPAENVRRQMWRTDPGQDQKTCVVSDEPNVALASFLIPADEPIPAARCRGAELHAMQAIGRCCDQARYFRCSPTGCS
jgi:hypothetical protein